MSERIHENPIQHVTLDDYYDAKSWRATAADLMDQLTETQGSDAATYPRMIQRLLNGDGSGATDWLVEIRAIDELDQGMYVMVRPIDEQGSHGRAGYYVAADGIILKEKSDTADIERGYFVGAPEGAADELMFDLAQISSSDELPVKYLHAPLPPGAL